MRGSSGANIVIDDTVAYKYGDDRVIEQGRWLLAHCKATDALPEIVALHGDGYVMERLSVPDLAELNTQWGYTRLLDALEQVWTTPKAHLYPRVSFDLAAHLKRMEPLIPASRISPQETRSLLHTLGLINWLALERANTHGDPIIDNVLMRGDDIVLIDPIPATPAIPDVKASDLGRVLQSVLGYEKYRYEYDYALLDPIEWVDTFVADNLKGVSPSRRQANEMMATAYWAVFHLMRSTVYVTNRIAMDIHDNCIATAIELMDHYSLEYVNACLDDRSEEE